MLPALQWVLGIGGLGLLAFGLLWDRPGWRGRATLRCRKCWFDLTGTPGVRGLLSRRVAFGIVLNAGDEGVVRDGGGGDRRVVCGECGTAHKTVRSMRRVRRRWLAALLGCGFVLGGYVWSAWHRTQFAGWVGLVPTPVALLTIPLMSGEQGSPSDLDESQGSGRPRLPIRLRWQIGGRLGRPDTCTMLDRWLVRTLAQAEDIDVLTDPTSKRGALYQSFYFSLYSQGRLGDAERQWAGRVHRIDWRCVNDAMIAGRFIVRPRVRFLIRDQELDRRLELLGSIYEIETHQHWHTDGWLDIEPIGSGYNEWWDGAVVSDWNRSFAMFQYPHSNKEAGRLRGYLYNGSADSDTWWPVACIHKDLLLDRASMSMGAQYPVPAFYGMIDVATAIDGFEVVENYDESIAWIEKNLVAVVNWNRVEIEESYDGYIVHERAPVSVKIHSRATIQNNRERRDVPIDDIDAFTFGGAVRLVLEVVDSTGIPQNPRAFGSMIAEGDSAWWAVRDAIDDDGHRVLEHGGEIVPLRLSDEGKFKDTFVIDEGGRQGEFKAAYIQIDFEPGIRPLADVDGERYLTAPVKIPLIAADAELLGKMLVAQDPSE